MQGTRPTNKKQLITDSAFRLFSTHGYCGTPVSAIARESGVTKAAVTFHFPAKQDLADELATPLISALAEVVHGSTDVEWPLGVADMCGRFLDVLIENPALAAWLDSDLGLQSSTSIGNRLIGINERLVQLIAGSDPTPTADTRATTVLGGLWRPVRMLSPKELSEHRDEQLAAALVSFGDIDDS